MYGQSNAILDPKTGETLMYSELLKGKRVVMPPGYSMHAQPGKLHVDNGEDINLVELLLQRSSGGEGGNDREIELQVLDGYIQWRYVGDANWTKLISVSELGGASIDDTTISTETTWSSSKIEDFVLTNDDVVWTDVSGENLSIDYTKEGYLREVEIWGNTIQNEEDLADIQHLGELYVDDEGEPILDSQGREQYKIEIESCNKNLFNKNIGILENTIIQSSGAFGGYEGDFTQDVFIPIKPDTSYTFSTPISTNKRVAWYDENKVFINRYSNGATKITAKSPITAKYLKYSGGLSSIDNLQIEEGTINTGFTPHQSNKTTILLPCQLMKVGDVKDRLYWDSEKGKYVVEKNVVGANIDFTNPNISIVNDTVVICNKSVLNKLPNLDLSKTTLKSILNIGGKWIDTNIYKDKPAHRLLTNNQLVVQLDKTLLNSYDIQGVNDYLSDKNVIFYYIQTPQLIETNITEPIKLPTYKDKTHIFVTGNVNGSIKAKAPLDGGKAILSLSQENKELQSVNQELKATNDIQDELINTTMLATDEVFSLLEPLLVNAIDSLNLDVSPLINMYVAMIQRGLKKIGDIPERYREQVSIIINESKNIK